jgi:hypothetical protein
VRNLVDDAFVHATEKASTDNMEYVDKTMPDIIGLHQNTNKRISLLPIVYGPDDLVRLQQGLNTQNVLIHPDSEYGEELKKQDARAYSELCMKYGVVIAGIPEGHPLYIKRWLTEVVVNLDTEVRQLLCIQSIHTKWAILKQSIAARINHILRSLPPSIIQETNFINRFNMIMKCFLADLVKVDPTFIEDHSFKIAQLLTESGGGGYHTLGSYYDPVLPRDL